MCVLFMCVYVCAHVCMCICVYRKEKEEISKGIMLTETIGISCTIPKCTCVVCQQPVPQMPQPQRRSLAFWGEQSVGSPQYHHHLYA